MSEEADRYERLHEILNEARGQSGSRLEAFLDSACEGDETLRAEVVELLQLGMDDTGEAIFAEDGISKSRAAMDAMVEGVTSSWLPEQIGGYSIVRQIGHGGMGIVYEATQESPRRSVAIKLLHPIHATEGRLRRFRQEAELLGRLQHPGIAQIFEAGSYDIGRGPQPYIAMELVDGVDIRAYCQREDLGIKARTKLLAAVADAVQYAHDHGVVHRDLKPDNVLVNAQGQPRILDFGIARAVDDATPLSTVLTEQGQLIGTLAYMAPEQLSQSPDAITPKVDVYALGVLGFELLTNQLPVDIEDMPVPKAIARLSTTEPPLAGNINAAFKGDIETMLGMALEQDPVRRYQSAAVFAGDLRRHLNDLPIQARPPSRTYLIRKFTRRHRALVGGSIATILVALVGTVIATSYALDARDSASTANERATEMERASYISGISAANSAINERDYSTAAEYLDRTPTVHRGWEFDYLISKLSQHDRDWPPPEVLTTEPVFDRDGSVMFAMMADGTIGRWGAEIGNWRDGWKPEGGVGAGNIIAKSAGSVALHGPSNRFAVVATGGILIGPLDGNGETQIIPGSDSTVLRIHAWDASGEQLLYRTGTKTKIWNGQSSRVLIEEEFGWGRFNHAGNQIALASGGNVRLIDPDTGEELHRTKIRDVVLDLSFSPDDQTLAIACLYRNVYLLDGTTLVAVAHLTGHQARVDAVSWSRDGSQVITTSQDGTARVWDRNGRPNPPPGSEIIFATGMRGETQASVTPKGSRLLVVGKRLRRFPLGEPTQLRGHPSYVYQLSFSPDGSVLTSRDSSGGDTFVWDVRAGALKGRFPDAVHDPASGLHTPFLNTAGIAEVSSDGQRVVTATASGMTHIDINTAEALPTAKLPIASKEPFVQQIHQTLGRRTWGPHPHRAISPDGRSLAAIGKDCIEVFDNLDGAPLDPLAGDYGVFLAAEAFSAPDWKDHLRGRLIGHVGPVFCMAFSPDGTRIASGGNDATVRIWDAETLEQLLVLRGHTQYVQCVAFSPDGSVLASASGDTTVRLWDTMPLSERRAVEKP